MILSRETKAIILAAGKGTRMKSDLPKVLHKIFSKTLVERVINATKNVENLTEIFVIVGHQAELVDEHVIELGKELGIKIKTVLQQPQLGTGDAVNKAYSDLENFDGNVLVLCGDTPLLTTKTLSDLIKNHEENKQDLTVLSAIVDNPTNYGRIVRDDNCQVQRIVEEKDATPQIKGIDEINAGVYCLDWAKIKPAFSQLTTNNAQGEYYLTDIVSWSAKNGLNTNAFVLENNYEIFGINSKKHLAEATRILNHIKINQLLDDGVSIISPETTYVSPETTIQPDTIIYPNTYIDGANSLGMNNILGPNTFIKGNVTTEDNVSIVQSTVSYAIISKNVSIGPFAHIRDGVEVGENSRIGNFVEIKKSTIDTKTNVAHLSYIGDSELGKNVNIGAGTITANYNALTKEKSKTIIKDDVKIGSNSVLVAPVTIEQTANVAAGSVITKNVPEGALAITRSPQKLFEGYVKDKLNK